MGSGSGTGRGRKRAFIHFLKLFIPVLFPKIVYVPCKRHGDVNVADATEKSSLEM
jgi:hypothetical protein